MAEPATNSVAPAWAHGPAVSASMPPSTSSSVSGPIRARSRAILSSELSMKPLAAPSRVDRHAERLVGRDLGEAAGERGARVDRHPGPAARLADHLDRAVDVGGRLGVEGDGVRAGAGELGDLALGRVDHEVDVELGVEVAQRLHDDRPHRDRRDEVAVHDVDVDHRRARGEDLGDLGAQAPEVGGEDGRSDAVAHTVDGPHPSAAI